VWISIIFGELINFPLQQRLTFNNHGPLAKQVRIYVVGVLVVNGICMVAFFVINTIIFAPLFGEKATFPIIIANEPLGGVTLHYGTAQPSQSMEDNQE